MGEHFIDANRNLRQPNSRQTVPMLGCWPERYSMHWKAVTFSTHVVLFAFFIGATTPAGATLSMNDSKATTESSCNFGMAKGQARGSCQVPIPDGCAVANQPGSTKPWSSISKGGHTACRFNEKDTDWKTRITGICGKCTTSQCSARFGVMFDCSPTNPQSSPSQKSKP